MFELSAFSQLDSVVNILSDSYSKDSYSFIKIPTKKNYVITGNTYWDSIYIMKYKGSVLYYYNLLDSFATNEDLIKLTSHKSPIIQFYSAFALGKRDTILLPIILEKMLDNPIYAACSSTDVVFDRLSASMIFTSLWQRKRATGYPSDIYMDKLDSIYLLHKNTPEIDIGMQLGHLRSNALKPTIEILAFERKNMSAIRYMNEWYKGEYYTQLNKVYLELLDSNIVEYSRPATKKIITNLIDLGDKETLRKLGGWLKNNKEKWIGIKGIDEILDKSWEIKDSIKWGHQRYPFTNNDIKFLLGEWAIISGMNINNIATSDTVILERKEKQKGQYQKIGFDLSSEILFSHYYENINDKKVKMVGNPKFDAINKRISFSSLDWDWYKIYFEENRLVLIRE